MDKPRHLGNTLGAVNKPRNISTQIFRGSASRYTPTAKNPNPILSKTQPIKPKPRSQPVRSDFRETLRNINTPMPNLSFEETFDEFVETLQSRPINEAFEAMIKRLFKSENEVFWVVQSEGIFAPSHKLLVKAKKGILIDAIESNEPIYSNPQFSNPMFNEESDGAIIRRDKSVMVIPWEKKWVIQIGRHPSNPFLERDMTTANTLISKLSVYSDILFSTNTLLDDACALVCSEPTASDLCVKIRKYLRCDSVEFWCFKPKLTQTVVIREDSKSVSGDIVPMEKIGATQRVLLNQVLVNEANIENCSGYRKAVDGPANTAFLAVPYVDNTHQIWAGVVKRAEKQFSIMEQSLLKAILPFAVKVLCFAISPPQMDQQLDHFEHRLKALLEVAEILSGVLDIDLLLPTIMDRACKLLDAERCSLFLVDSAHHELVTRFHGGLDNAIHLKIGRGIVGSCAESGETVNIRDAYADQRFDRSVDLATGFTTRSLLCIPIYNNRGEITGVTEMINKKDGLFDEDDEKMLMAFNVFCGISLDNARLYKASLDLTRQLRSFIQMSVALGTTDTLNSTLQEIMNNIRSIVNASRVTMFLNNENDNSLYEHLTMGDPSSYGTMFVQEAVKNRKFMLFDHKDVLGRTQTEQLNSAIEKILAAGLDADLLVFGQEMMEYEEEDMYQEEYNQEYEEYPQEYAQEYEYEQTVAMPSVSTMKSSNMKSQKSQASRVTESRIGGMFGSSASNVDSNPNKDSEVICCLPMFSSETTILGVIELSCNWKVMSEDIKLLDCFSVFAGVSIERSQLKDRAKMGQAEVEMKNWISEKERKAKGQIPSKLLIAMDKLTSVLTAKFDAPDWDGIGHIKVVFAVFDLFDLTNHFNITNEKLFRFLTEIRSTYNKVPYHNWRHAVDVTQFVTYQILSGGLDATLTKFELLAMIVAAICHDANHDGFTNVYNVKAETPLGILFKNQSVMETHHCSVAIGVISKDECNLFSGLSATDNRNIWSLIISMILATDMAKHFDILKEFNNLFDNGKFTLDDAQHRIMLLEMILKCADVSNVARPFELADKWCDVLCEEFFRQGDLEKASGMEYTSALNDREHLDKPKSQIGFYTFVCLPLFEAVAKAVPKLECNVKQLLSNLERWKAATEEEADK